jgi:putative phosphonate metabolism protein
MSSAIGMNGTSEAPQLALDLSVARFAIYYAPPAGSCWWNEGSRWLGRDAITGRSLNAPQVPGLSRALHDLTQDPRRYGLHATLKAPMRLAPQAHLGDLSGIAAAVAARHAPFDLTVHTDVVDTDNGKRPGFVALRPRAGAVAAKAVDALAADCVQAFDALRAPPTDAELAKRHAQPLTSRQRELLAQWGYPYVFDEFRFHITLSDRVDANDAAAITDWWQPRVQALGPMRVDSLALFVQPSPGAPFLLHERFALGEAA